MYGLGIQPESGTLTQRLQNRNRKKETVIEEQKKTRAVKSRGLEVMQSKLDYLLVK